MTMNIAIEMTGYLGSLLIVISMLMTSVKKLRIVNTVGSIIFTAYAIIIRSYPTAFMNFCLIIINIVNLIKLIQAEKNYRIINCYKDETIVQLYLKENLQDIQKFFPEFSMETGGHALTYLIFTGSSPIGITIGKMIDAETLSIELDYTTPSHRDYSVGNLLYKYLAKEWDIHKILFHGKMVANDSYLEKMNFQKTPEGFVKQI